jgi:hypothetical protein
MRAVLIFFIIFFNIVFSQEQFKIKKTFKQYNFVAKDSFLNCFNKSKDYLLKNNIDNDSCLANKYSINNLKLISVPCFRINKNAIYGYNLETSILNFIDFKDSVYYQKVYVINKKDECVYNIDFPFLDLEIENFHKKDEEHEYPFKKDYNQRLKELKVFNNPTFENYNFRKNVYIFELFGFYSIVFEYHVKTNKFYARWVDGPYVRELLEIDAFMKKYDLVNQIKCLAIKDYEFKTVFD